jgi:CRISPR-associated protein (TIGR03986 family)
MTKWPVHQNPRDDRAAKAPYNFVPLPERVVTVDPETLPDQDVYDPDRHTGWIDCKLTTASPLYVRAALDKDEFERSQDTASEQKRLWPEQVRNKPDFFYTQDRLQPVIPGSSLRGMLRALVEIVSYGKMQWVTDQQRYSYRAVAAARSDPLRDPYRSAVGAFARNVQAGYLFKRGDTWYALPALAPQARGWPEKGAYLKVKERRVLEAGLPGYIDLNSPRYRPQLHDVSFDVEVRQGKRGSYAWISHIGPADAGHAHRGMLVCSGNMLETSKPGQKSPRRNHALVLMPDNRAEPLKIRPEAVRDYLNGLTPFQREALGDWGGPAWGCLKEGAPIFYLAEGEEIVDFGHCPNFRVSFRRPGSHRASSPHDYVPEALRAETDTDLAEAIFGYTRAEGEGKAGAYAGRVFVTDARLVEGQEQVWLADTPLVPKILASPKPTTFQHYLVQTTPNQSANLAHYATETPGETTIRGHKLYWHKGPVEAGDIEESNPQQSQDTQHTQICPVREGVAFAFRLYFENLSLVELGALLWVLEKAQDDAYRLKLGMGKPRGMGAVRIKHSLHPTARSQRYGQLFDGHNWMNGAQPEGDLADRAIADFETLILEDPALNPTSATSLDQVDRIRALLAILSWPGPDAAETDYLLIEHPQHGNQYKDRPVLPDPLEVVPGEPVQPLTRPQPRRPVHEEQPPPPKPAGEQRPAVDAEPAVAGPQIPAAQEEKGKQHTGEVTFYNFNDGTGTVLPDGADAAVEVRSTQFRAGVTYLAAGARVSFRVIEEADGSIHLLDIGPV